jgi:pimeloyl-ACP methyl ester carboxylesterase
MKWGKAAAAGGAALGAAAWYNAAAARASGPLDNPLGGEEGALLWRGHRVVYTVHGSGSPLLLIHGLYTGASAFEWRHTVGGLAERHTVFTLDLLGFGRSDRPNLRYSPALYQALISDVMGRLIARPCGVVASSLSGAQTIALAARDSRHINALALIAPSGIAQLREGMTSPFGAIEQLLGAPIVGTSIYNGFTSPATMRRFLEATYADDRIVTDELVDAYVRCARQPGGKHAVGAFLGGRLDQDVRTALRRVRQPMLLLWGDQARQNPVQNAHAFRVLKPDADWALISEAGDMPHDERPVPTNTALLRFLERAKSGIRGPQATPWHGMATVYP